MIRKVQRVQISRLLEIVYILLSKKSVTASELADRFFVSTRTIYRDLDALSAASIPVYAERGKGGGIRLMPGFALSKSLLTEQEQDEILAALQGMRATGTSTDGALDKLSSLFQRQRANWVDVDFGDWSGVDERFEQLKQAILEKRLIRFTYFSTRGDRTERLVEPLQMWFKHRAWYLKAFDLGRNDYRLFKYARMRGLKLTEERFERDAADAPGFADSCGANACVLRLVLWIDESQSYRVFEDFAPSQIQPHPEGGFIVTAHLIDDDWSYGYVLGFGEHAKVLDPPEFAEQIVVRLKKTYERYL